MGYVESSLLKDERIKYMSKPHWIVFGQAIAMTVLAFFVWAYAPSIFSSSIMIFSVNLVAVAVLALFVIAIYSFIKATIIYKTSEYGVTNKRVIMKMGWIQRSSFETFLDKVEAINIDQSVTGRMLGFGTVIIIGTGGTRDYFIYVPQPLLFRKAVQQQISGLSDQH